MDPCASHNSLVFYPLATNHIMDEALCGQWWPVIRLPSSRLSWEKKIEKRRRLDPSLSLATWWQHCGSSVCHQWARREGKEGLSLSIALPVKGERTLERRAIDRPFLSFLWEETLANELFMNLADCSFAGSTCLPFSVAISRWQNRSLRKEGY